MDSHFHRHFNGIVELDHHFKDNAKMFLDGAGKKIKTIKASSAAEQGYHEGQVNKRTTGSALDSLFGGTYFKDNIMAPQCTTKQLLCDTPQEAGGSDDGDVPNLTDHEGRVIV
jgi:hypothetical protein